MIQEFKHQGRHFDAGNRGISPLRTETTRKNPLDPYNHSTRCDVVRLSDIWVGFSGIQYHPE